MQLICPSCQTVFPIEAAINDVQARNAIKRAFSLTPIGIQLLAYVQLFKPPTRALSMTKLVRLLDELVGMIQEGKVKYKGNVYAAPQQYWQDAIEQMLNGRDQLALPLDSHGYLVAVIAAYAKKAGNKAETKAEHKKAAGGRQEKKATKPSKMPQNVKNELNQFLNKTTTSQGENNG